MQKLSFPQYDFRIKPKDGKNFIFDSIRKKYILITPEEWVRQNLIKFLITEKKYPKSLIGVEVGLKLNSLQKRADVLCYNSQAEPLLLVECKAPNVKISQQTFEQIAQYNIHFRVKHLLVSNGLNHYACKIDFKNKSYEFLEDIPSYDDLQKL